MNPRTRLHFRALPMPLWLQGGVEALVAALASALLVVLVLGGVWLADGFSGTSIDFIAQVAGQGWLILHGVPLNLTMDLPTVSPKPVTGTFWFLAWALALIPLGLGWRAGRRLGRASYTYQLWQALLGAGGTYAVFALVTSLLVGNGMVSINPLAGMLIPALLHTVAVMTGVRREAGSWGRVIGVDLADSIAQRSQYSRWAGSYLWSIVRAAAVGVLAAFGLAGTLMAVQLAVHWSDIIQVYQQLDAGIWGGVALTGLQLGLMPNLAVWTMAFTTGAGFALGVDTLVSPVTTSVGPQPALPVLTAVPTEIGGAGWLFLLLPVAAGVIAGWWLLREGENHLDEWLELKVQARWLSLSLSTLAMGLLLAVATATMSILPFLLSRGSLGIGRLTDLGPNPLPAAVLLGVEIGLGAMVGYLLAPLVEEHRYVVPDSLLGRETGEAEETAATEDTGDSEDAEGSEDETTTTTKDRTGRFGLPKLRPRRTQLTEDAEGSEETEVDGASEGSASEDSSGEEIPSSEK